MAKLFAPILAFTCDEIWQSMPHRASDDARNVLLNQMPEGFAQYALEDAAMEKWDVVMKLRQDVNGVLEKARADKRIGKALEAHVTLATEDAAIRSACEGVNLAEVCIVSDCVWAQPEEGAEVGTGVNYPNLTIGVSEAKGTKCPRCWMHSQQANAEGLCRRRSKNGRRILIFPKKALKCCCSGAGNPLPNFFQKAARKSLTNRLSVL